MVETAALTSRARRAGCSAGPAGGALAAVGKGGATLARVEARDVACHRGLRVGAAILLPHLTLLVVSFVPSEPNH
jgi:hypothetical protein